MPLPFFVCRIVSGMVLSILLLTAKAQEPALVLPSAHSSVVSKVYYSPDGALIASVSWDNTAKIRSAGGGLLFDLKAHTATVTAGGFSADGNRFYTCAMDSTVCAWDMHSGTLLYRKTLGQDWLTGLSVSPDGKTVLVGGWDGHLLWLSAANGKAVRSLDLHSSVLQLAVSADGRWISVLCKDSSIRLLTSTGERKGKWKFRHAFPGTASFRPDSRELLSGWSGHGPVRIDLLTLKVVSLGSVPVSAAAWSTDGRGIAAGDDSGHIFTWTYPFTAPPHRCGSLDSKTSAIAFVPASTLFYCAALNGTVQLGNTVTGRLEKKWTPHKDWINGIAVSPRTGEIVTASTDQTLALWRYNEPNVRPLTGHSAVVADIALDSSGGQLVSLSADSLIRCWSTATGKITSSIYSPGPGMNHLQISRRGQVLLSGLDSTAWINDSVSAIGWRPLRGARDWIQTSAFSGSGNLAATGSWDGSISVYSCPVGLRLFQTPERENAVAGTMAFATGDSLLAVGYWNGDVGLYHLPEGKRLAMFEGHSGKVRSVRFSRDNQKLLSAGWDSTVRLWDIPNRAPLQTFKEQDAINEAVFLPGDNLILIASMDKTVKCLDWQMASPRYRCTGPSMPVVGLWYDSVSNRITGLSEENKCYVWDAANGRSIGTYELGDGHERAISVAGEMLAIATDDNRFTLFRKGTDSALYSAYAIDSADYLITATNNRYDGTAGARDLLYYRCGREIVDLEQLKDLNWETGLAAKRMQMLPMTYTISGGLALICDYTPYVSEPKERQGSYSFRITARAGGLAGYQVRLNGRPVYTRNVIKKEGDSLLVTVPADSLRPYFSSADANEISVQAFTGSGVLSARGNSLYAPPVRRTVRAPDLYIVSVGVSTYKSPELHLSFPSLDAQRFAMAVSGSARKLFNTDNREHVHSFLFNESPEAYRPVSKRAVQELLDSLSRVTTPDDIVLFFFAGHGVLQDGDRDFYLLTPEASAFSIRGVEKQVAVSTRELMDWSHNLKAGKQILIMDACSSGKAVGNLQERIRAREVPEDQLRALENLRDKTGLYILSAASAGQAAYEMPEYGEGFLTYALLAGLRQGTGLRDNKFVDLNRWFNDAADRVKAMARRSGKLQEPQMIGGPSFDLGIMDSSLAARIPLAAEKNIIGRSQFIEDEDLLTDELDISGTADRYLSLLSSGEKNTGFIFIPESRRPETYAIRGRYKITDNRLSVNAFLLKGNRGKVAAQQAEGSLADMTQVMQKCVDALLHSIP